jgi:hypothetical protein
MSNTLITSGAALGLVVTVLTSVIKTINLSPRIRHTIAVVLAVVSSLLITWKQFNGDYSVDNLTKTFAAVYASSQLFYQYILSGTNLDQILTAFTPFGKAGRAADVAVSAVAPALADPPATSGE